MLKRVTASVIAAAILLALQSCGTKSLEDVLERNVKAHGGTERLQAVTTFYLTGNILAAGSRMPITIMIKRPDLIRMEVLSQNYNMIMAFDGDTAWWINPYVDTTKALALPEREAEKLGEIRDVFLGYLPAHRARGHAVELVGKEEIDGTEFYRLKLIPEDLGIQDIYLDTETFLIRKMSGMQKPGEEGRTTASVYRDYKEAGGLMIAHTVDELINGTLDHTLAVEQIKLNVDIADTLFRMPAGEE